MNRELKPVDIFYRKVDKCKCHIISVIKDNNPNTTLIIFKFWRKYKQYWDYSVLESFDFNNRIKVGLLYFKDGENA